MILSRWLNQKKKKGKFLKTLGASYITMVPVVCPCLDSDRWRNIYSLKLQMISSQKTTFSSLTWDHNICKVTKSCTILWTIVLWWLLCFVGEFIRLFWNSDGTTDIARCFVFGTPNERQKVRVFANVLRSQYHGAVWDIFYYKNTQTLHVYFVDKILFLCPLSDCWPFLASVFCYYVFIERKKTLSTDFSLIRDNVFIHYTPIILIKIKFMCLVLCIILKIFSKALCSIVTLSPECCRTSIHVYWWLKSTWPWRHSKLVPLVRWTPS